MHCHCLGRLWTINYVHSMSWWLVLVKWRKHCCIQLQNSLKPNSEKIQFPLNGLNMRVVDKFGLNTSEMCSVVPEPPGKRHTTLCNWNSVFFHRCLLSDPFKISWLLLNYRKHCDVIESVPVTSQPSRSCHWRVFDLWNYFYFYNWSLPPSELIVRLSVVL